MSDDTREGSRRLSAKQFALLIVGLTIFGALMGLREEFHSIWVRMLVAGCAGGVVGIFVLQLRKNRKKG
jgi:hypothetical protein